MEEFRVYGRRGRTFIQLLFMLLVFALGVVMLYYGIADLMWHAALIGAFLVIVCGAASIFTLRLFLGIRPLIIISGDGITDWASLMSAGHVGWEEIREFEVITYHNQVFLGFYLHDPDLIVNRSSGLKRWYISFNKKFWPTQVNIPLKNLNCTPAQLVDEISRRWTGNEGNAAGVAGAPASL